MASTQLAAPCAALTRLLAAALLLFGAAWHPSALAWEIHTSLRDAFPVFDDPPVLSAAEAEQTGATHARDMVIGVVAQGAARAYPVAVMGIHELGNDTLGGRPIAVTW